MRLHIEGGIGRPSMEATPRNRALWAIAKSAGKELGLDLHGVRAGGGSDGNTTSQYTATLDGREGLLAHAGISSPHRVGRYGVQMLDLEAIAVPEVRDAVRRGQVVVIDEIASMELFSDAFREAVLDALDAPCRVLATIQNRVHPFLDALRRRQTSPSSR